MKNLKAILIAVVLCVVGSYGVLMTSQPTPAQAQVDIDFGSHRHVIGEEPREVRDHHHHDGHTFKTWRRWARGSLAVYLDGKRLPKHKVREEGLSEFTILDRHVDRVYSVIVDYIKR